MDSYMNFQRSRYGRSQMFRNAPGMTVGMQCCMQPDMMPDRPSDMQPCMPANTPPTMSRPSMVQPVMSQPGITHSGMPQPGMLQPSAMGSYVPTGTADCPGTAIGPIESFPIGMGYVPMQQWRQTYSLDNAFNRGTIFPELDLPFLMGRCQ